MLVATCPFNMLQVVIFTCHRHITCHLHPGCQHTYRHHNVRWSIALRLITHKAHMLLLHLTKATRTARAACSLRTQHSPSLLNSITDATRQMQHKAAQHSTQCQSQELHNNPTTNMHSTLNAVNHPLCLCKCKNPMKPEPWQYNIKHPNCLALNALLK